MMDWLADEQSMCSVPECRQTPGSLHHQKSKAQVIQYLVILLCPGRQRVLPWGFSPSSAPWAGHGPLARQAGRQKPPMCSVPECRQTPGGLHHQKSKAQGGTVSSDPFQSLAGSKYTRGASILPSSLGMVQPHVRRAGRQNQPNAQFLSAGRPLAVCTTRNLNLRVEHYLVILFCPCQAANMVLALLPFRSSCTQF